jgi:hypothetical protein
MHLSTWDSVKHTALDILLLDPFHHPAICQQTFAVGSMAAASYRLAVRKTVSRECSFFGSLFKNVLHR